jgi:excisionase family DNA binding protein
MNENSTKGEALFGVCDAARALNISEPYVRFLTDTGRLACTRDDKGRRRFKPKDVRAFAKVRRRNQREILKHRFSTPV